MNWDGQRDTIVKVSQNEHLIAAACGEATSCLSVRHALAEGATRPEDLVGSVDKNSAALVLTRRGRVYQVTYGAVWDQPRVSAIGTGADLALGFLMGRCGRKTPTPKDVRDAFKYVFSKRLDCGGRIDVRSFG